MKYAFIDCGSAATRWYLLDDHKVAGMYKDEHGINSVHGKEELLVLLQEQYQSFLKEMQVTAGEIRFFLAAGMITSNLGLVEVPHQIAPVGLEDFWNTMKVLEGEDSPFDAPMYLVRGVKNACELHGFADLMGSDLMRGEELQTLGVLEKYPMTDQPVCIIELGSTTKLILVNEKMQILASYTSLSGQTYQAIEKGTFIGNSIVKRMEVARPDGYFDKEIVSQAFECVEQSGFLRSVMLVRFSDVLMEQQWYERELFFSALFAAEDKTWLMDKLGIFKGTMPKIYLVGQKRRCKIYKELISANMEAEVQLITDAAEVSELAVNGAVLLAKRFINA